MASMTGQTIRGYELREQLGEGGFGAVYRAYQAILKRDVAIKIILPRLANDPEFIRRFEFEAELVARLEHPYIVPLYDYWREPDRAYLVMRWLRGGSLRDVLNQHALSIDTTITILDQVTSALHIAHRAGVVHRDIKPANILLDEDGNAYLTDFGIAKSPDYQSNTGEGISGSIPYVSPEQLEGSEITPQTDIYALGVMLFEMLSGVHPFEGATTSEMVFKHLQEPLPDITNLFPDLPYEVNALIQRATAKQSHVRFGDVREIAVAFRSALGEEATSIVVSDESLDDASEVDLPNPYKGLRAFQESDADEFYGRGVLLGQVLDRLNSSDPEARFLAIVGPSGSGKSSVVRAGLIPAIRDGRLPGSEKWFISDMFPGSHPYAELEAALLRIAINPPPSLIEQLQQESGLMRAVKRILPPDDSELLLVIDQFEELFTLVEDEKIRESFLANLMEITADKRSRIRVIVTLRADFYDRPLQYRSFGELLRKRTEIILPMSEEELAEAIVQPAERVGARFQSGVVDTIIKDVSEQPGILPLLQYALTELFQQRTGRTMTLEAYHAIGGVTGALARRAEDLYSQMDEAGRIATQQLFLRLITLGEGAEDTRRRVLRMELPDGEQMENVLRQYGQYRLLTFDRDPVTRGPTVEVAHEALIRTWERLREWIEHDREGLRIHRRLTQAANEWQQSGQDTSYLSSGARLGQFELWSEQSNLVLNQIEYAYLKASILDRDEHRRIDEARKAHEAALQETANRRLRYLAATLAIFLIVAISLTVFAFDQRSNSEVQAETALAAQDDAVNQAATAVAAQNTSEFNEHRAETQVVVAQQNAVTATIAVSTATVAQGNAEFQAATAQRLADEAKSIAWVIQSEKVLDNGDGNQLALGLAINALRINAPPGIVQDTATRTLLSSGLIRQFPANRHSDRVWSVSFSLDGRLVATGSEDGTVILWDAVSGESLRTFTGHTGSVQSVAFSPDGSQIATGSSDRTVMLWDVASGEILRTFAGHTDIVVSVAFSPDGSQIATGSSDRTMMLWRVESGEVLRTFTRHTDRVWSVAFSPDGRQLATGSEDGTVILWDVASGETLRRFTGHSGRVRSVAFSPDGQQLATGSSDTTAILWSVASGEVLRTFAGHTDVVLSVAFSPDGSQIATGSSDRTMILWRVESGEALRTFTGHTGNVQSVLFSPDGSQIATGSSDRTMILWGVVSGEVLRTFAGHRGWVLDVAFSPDGRQLATVSSDKTMILWDVVSGEVLRTFTGHSGSIWSVAFSPDGGQIATGSEDGTMILWDVVSGEVLRTFTGHSGSIWGVAFSPDGGQIATGSEDSTMILWDAGSGEILRTFIGHTEPIWSVVFSPDGQQLATGSSDRTMILWDVASGEASYTFAGHRGAVLGVAFSPDGQQLATGSSDRTMILWDVASGEALRMFTGHRDVVLSVAFSPDGQHLVTGSYDRTMILWDVASGEAQLTFSAHSGWVWSVAYSPDGRQVATGSEDGTMLLWDVVSGDAQRTFTAQNGPALSVAYSPDGRQVTTGSEDGTVTVWDVVSGEVLRTLTAQNGPALSVAYSPDGRQVATGSENGTATVWDVVSGEVLRTFTEHSDRVRSVVFSPDGRLLATGSSDRTVILWDIASGNVLRLLAGHDGSVLSVVFSPDGRHLVTGSSDRTMILWDVVTGEALRKFTGHSGFVWSVSFSPDGRYLVTGSSDRTIILWDMATGEALRTLSRQSDVVRSVAYSPDGSQVATGSEDGTIILWDVATGDFVRTFTGHGGSILSVAYSPDGSQVATASEDGTLKLWRNDTIPRLIQWTFTNRLVHELSCEERRRYDIDPFCPEDVNRYPTWTPYPTLTPTGSPTPLLIWTPIDTPTPSNTPMSSASPDQ